ncbi:MAG: sugar phosphate isomerase/epimerase [Gemmataceae bacterium]|nr:sugar phosphate isomerase/epimerase [Gemmataceae bacterium]
MRLTAGIRLDCLGLPFRKAITRAGRLGARAVQFNSAGELSPEKLSETGRRELLHLLHSENLHLAALHCPLRQGLETPVDQEPRLAKILKAIDLSASLGARLVTLHPGKIPADTDSTATRALRESLSFLAVQGDRRGVRIGLVTGPDSGQALADLISTFDTGALGAVIDPAGLQLHGFDLEGAVKSLVGRVHLVWARELASSHTRVMREVPLGSGSLDWVALLATLHETGYQGPLLLSREEGIFPPEELEASFRFLQSLLPAR